MSTRKLVISYMFLVILPVICLAPILEAGRKLSAPRSVAGAWNVDADFSSLARSDCGAFFAAVQQPLFAVSQSGAQLLFNFNDPPHTSAPGTILAGSVTTAGGAHQPSITASIGRDRVLTGKIGCGSDTPVAFRALRQLTLEKRAN